LHYICSSLTRWYSLIYLFAKLQATSNPASSYFQIQSWYIQETSQATLSSFKRCNVEEHEGVGTGRESKGHGTRECKKNIYSLPCQISVKF
jgi:hypothetical protein